VVVEVVPAVVGAVPAVEEVVPVVALVGAEVPQEVVGVVGAAAEVSLEGAEPQPDLPNQFRPKCTKYPSRSLARRGCCYRAQWHRCRYH